MGLFLLQFKRKLLVCQKMVENLFWFTPEKVFVPASDRVVEVLEVGQFYW